MSTVYWYGIRSTKPSLREVVMTDMSCITITNYGIVYSAMNKHNERLLKHYEREELNYYTHYNIVIDGVMLRSKSWGGAMTQAGMRVRAHEFSRRVARLVSDEARDLPVSPSTEMKRELHRTRTVLSGLVKLCLMWVSSTFPRIGLVWSSPDDYPTPLRDAIALLGETGGEADKG